MRKETPPEPGPPGPPRPFRADGRPLACAISPVGGLTPGHLAALFAAGVDFVQLRDRAAGDGAFERFLARADAEFPETLPRILVNDRLAAALRYPVAGVHLPETGLPVPEARALAERCRRRWLVGRSVHGVEGALRAEAAGADYVLLGPVSPTGAKRRALPPDALREACRRCSVPVWAVGGLNPETLPRLRGAGVRGAAAIRALADPERSAAFVAALRSLDPDGSPGPSDPRETGVPPSPAGPARRPW